VWRNRPRWCQSLRFNTQTRLKNWKIRTELKISKKIEKILFKTGRVLEEHSVEEHLLKNSSLSYRMLFFSIFDHKKKGVNMGSTNPLSFADSSPEGSPLLFFSEIDATWVWNNNNQWKIMQQWAKFRCRNDSIAGRSHSSSSSALSIIPTTKTVLLVLCACSSSFISFHIRLSQSVVGFVLANKYNPFLSCSTPFEKNQTNEEKNH
jgi:hypothetical protein